MRTEDGPTSSAASASSYQLPIEYHAGDFCGLLYRVEPARAYALCAELSVEPWLVFGRAVAGVYAWQYRETSIGPYAELGIGILARRRGQRPSLWRLALDTGAQEAQALWVVALPVTTELACNAGRQLWGYPKYVTSIETTFDDRAARVRLGSELELELAAVRGAPRVMPIATFTQLDGQLLRTRIDVRCAPRLGVPRRAALRLLGADGPCARAVRELGLHALSPSLAFHTRDFRASLPAGTHLGPAHRA